jgi:Uma2 family endonuclease
MFPPLQRSAHPLLDSLRPLHRSEYERLTALGSFSDERIELLSGLLVTMSPQDAEHAEVVCALTERLGEALRGRARVRPQLPLALGDDSEPEPDIAVVPLGDYSREHPTKALWVIEVSDSSLRKDREVKGPLYAAAGIGEYWIVDLVHRAVEVHRAPSGGLYADVSRHGQGGTLTPLAFTDLTVDVSQLVRVTKS